MFGVDCQQWKKTIITSPPPQSHAKHSLTLSYSLDSPNPFQSLSNPTNKLLCGCGDCNYAHIFSTQEMDAAWLSWLQGQPGLQPDTLSSKTKTQSTTRHKKKKRCGTTRRCVSWSSACSQERADSFTPAFFTFDSRTSTSIGALSPKANQMVPLLNHALHWQSFLSCHAPHLTLTNLPAALPDPTRLEPSWPVSSQHSCCLWHLQTLFVTLAKIKPLKKKLGGDGTRL